MVGHENETSASSDCIWCTYSDTADSGINLHEVQIVKIITCLPVISNYGYFNVKNVAAIKKQHKVLHRGNNLDVCFLDGPSLDFTFQDIG